METIITLHVEVLDFGKLGGVGKGGGERGRGQGMADPDQGIYNKRNGHSLA